METIIYRVRKGDTIWKIAKRFGTTVEDIARYNGIIDPDVLSVDQILRIPVGNNDNIINDNNIPKIYIVRLGDTLWKIAKKYNVSVSDLINWNGITEPDRICEGQAIIIRK